MGHRKSFFKKLLLLALIVFSAYKILLNLNVLFDTSADIREYRPMVREFYKALKSSERKVYSQNKEDGVIESLIKIFNLTERFYVEIGTQNGRECNTRFIREELGWKGFMFDGSNQNRRINLYKELIHANNVLRVFEKYRIQENIDILSEDTDYADYWILEKILGKYRPKIIIHEVNQQELDKCVTVPKSDQVIYWDGSSFHGASVCAFYCLAKQFKYTMVYCESAGVNCFLVRNDLIESVMGFDASIVQRYLTPRVLQKYPKFSYPNTSNEWYQVKC